MKKVGVIVVLFVFLFAISAYADVDTGYSCAMDCQTLSQNGDQYYCNQVTQTCFLIDSGETVATATATVASTASTTDERIAALEKDLASLENDLTILTSDFSLTKGEILAIQNQITSLQRELATLQSQDQDLSSKTTTLSTGLAGLQENLDSLKEKVSERQSLSSFMAVFLVIIIIAGAAGGIYYYVNRMQKSSNPEIRDFINNSIKQGKKLPQIKQELGKAGWSNSDIEDAYSGIAKQNYQQYKSSQPERRSYTERPRPYSATKRTQNNLSSLSDNPKKMIAIAAVSILIIIIIILVLRGVSTGEAIFFKKLIGGSENGTSGENTYTVECTPPHLLNPTGDGCCLDSDASGICDTIELQGPGLGVGGQCNDNRECSVGLYCISNSCSSLDSLYTGQGDCSKLCSYYALKVLTSDGESYDLKPKQGSYTAAGALEWKVLAMPQYCKGEPAIVPINIIKKRTGEVVMEEAIVLHEGEKSPILTHPTIPKIGFTLTIADVFESCPE